MEVLKDDPDETKLQNVMKDSLYGIYLFRLGVKCETWQDEVKPKSHRPHTSRATPGVRTGRWFRLANES